MARAAKAQGEQRVAAEQAEPLHPLVVRLRDIRDELGLTQKEVVARLATSGVTKATNQQWISGYERGERRLLVEHVRPWAAALGYEADVVMALKGTPAADLIVAASEALPETVEAAILLLRTLDRLEPTARNILINSIRVAAS